MKHFLAIALLCSCAGADLEQQDLDDEIGEASEALGAKVSPLYQAGWNQSTYGLAKTSQPDSSVIILPGHSTIRYKFSGSDPCDDGNSNHLQQSWHEQVRRGFNDAKSQAQGHGLGWTFTAVADDVTPNVTFVRGPVGPSAASSATIKDYINVLAQHPLVKVTESQHGDYYRHDGMLVVTLDINDAYSTVHSGDTTFNSCATDTARHQLLEHIGHVAALFPMGSGIYLDGVLSSPDVGFQAWSSIVLNPSPFIAPYDTGNYPVGQLCRIGSWSNGPGITGYAPLTSGTCADN